MHFHPHHETGPLFPDAAAGHAPWDHGDIGHLPGECGCQPHPHHDTGHHSGDHVSFGSWEYSRGLGGSPGTYYERLPDGTYTGRSMSA
jgi:hypothetical protein